MVGHKKFDTHVSDLRHPIPNPPPRTIRGPLYRGSLPLSQVWELQERWKGVADRGPVYVVIVVVVVPPPHSWVCGSSREGFGPREVGYLRGRTGERNHEDEG